MQWRLPAQWRLKLVGITAFMAVFFVAYFFTLRHPLLPVTVMPLTWLDQWVGFVPGALWLYLSLWAFVMLPPALMGDRRELVMFGWASVSLAAVGLGIFLLWPTSVPSLNAVALDSWAFDYLKRIDASGNACPSLHVAYAIFTALWLDWVLRDVGASRWFGVIGWCWCVGILYSTMATHQHVALDVLAGAVLGGAIALVFRRRRADQRASDAIIVSGKREPAATPGGK